MPVCQYEIMLMTGKLSAISYSEVIISHSEGQKVDS